MSLSPWWAPHVYADRRPFLLARSRITAATRAWFGANDFVEAETTILQVSPGNEAHLHAFSTELIADDARRSPLYLHTSPEFACKKLLAAGEERLFTFARVFRNRERSALHHPEPEMSDSRVHTGARSDAGRHDVSACWAPSRLRRWAAVLPHPQALRSVSLKPESPTRAQTPDAQHAGIFQMGQRLDLRGHPA